MMLRADRLPLLGVAAATAVFGLAGCGSEGPSTASDSQTDGIDTLSGSSSDTGESSGETSDGETGSEAGGQSCMASDACPATYVCAYGTCTPGDGPCTSDAECTGDTWCCAGDCLPEGEGGVCIPFAPGQTNDACLGDVAIGLFEPNVQCEWLAPAPGEPFPDHVNVLTTPLVADLPHDSGFAHEIVIVTYNCDDGGSQSGYGSDPSCFGVVRVLDGQTCATKETIDDPATRAIAATPPAIGDLDGDGVPEIVTLSAVTGVVAFTWDASTARYVTMWATAASDISGSIRWDGPSLHDLDNDGFPEVISSTEVYDGFTGARLNPGQVLASGGAGVIGVVGDVDADGAVEIVADDVYRWSSSMNRWEVAYPGGPGGRHYGFADFGTPGASAAQFDATLLDGVAEIVTVVPGSVRLHTLEGQELLRVDGITGGGPPTIGDFDNDGFPEIASAGGNNYRVFDLDCATGGAGCAAPYVRWIAPSQDLSSATTGSSIFDFEGDGAAEAVYGDECYVRVYDGATGDVLYSAARTSCTWYENPVVADPDNDQNTEILVGSNTNCNVGCPEIDPIHPGVRCEDGDDCPSGTCNAGLCRCTDAAGCSDGHVCTAPPPGTPGNGDTCRASHPAGIAISGVRVLRDRLDRWASSRPLWNQHAYSITNINDDLSVPSTASWNQNFADPALNNYRQNRQGDASAAEMPDITGHLDDTACTVDGTDLTLLGMVCNRGLKAVAAALPATFYLGDPAAADVLCVAYTAEPVPVGECREVSCAIDSALSGTITMVVNDDGMGGQLTVECIDTNNTDVVEVSGCFPPG